nr:EAL domain-containing protein [uncultured Cohaesibacter sp.]
MIRNAKKIAGYTLLAVASAGLLTLGMQYGMRWQIKKDIEHDLQVSAGIMLERASNATQTAINVLNDLAQSSGLSCTNDYRYRYSEAARSNAWIDTIGLVDRSGNLVCTDIGQSARQTGLLSAYQPGNKDITLSLSAGSNKDDLPSLLVVRHVKSGRRLVARVPGELILIDPVRNDLRKYRFAMLSLIGGARWFILEPDVTKGDIIDKVSLKSDYLPFEVQLSTTEAALDVIGREERGAINIIGFLMGLIMIGVGWYFGRYRPSDGDIILDALDNGEIVPYMQPIIDLDTGAITGCEVLARWNKPDGGVVSPGEFIPLAQNYHLTREVTCEIMKRSCEFLDPVVREGQVFKVALNLFSHQMLDDSIVADIESVFAGSNLGFSNLIFEISDRVPIQEMDLARDVISQIRALGAEIALDDVGSGHSGLYNLSSISVDIVKLDKLLIDALDGGFAGFDLVQGLIDLAKKLNIGVIAEGVETEEQVIQLRKMGVSAAQGYLFAPPLPAASFCELMKVSRRRNGGQSVEEDGAVEAEEVAQAEEEAA